MCLLLLKAFGTYVHVGTDIYILLQMINTLDLLHSVNVHITIIFTLRYYYEIEQWSYHALVQMLPQVSVRVAPLMSYNFSRTGKLNHHHPVFE